MPIKIDDQLPARYQLELENIFVMTEQRAKKQDIRPLKILILNLMPTKIDTETQLLRLLGNTPLQVEVDLLQTASYQGKNTPKSHMLKFYKTFDDVKHEKFDGMIVTGAPVENLKFEEVAYWDELCEIFDWAETHVYSTFFICWGAQAGLYHYYNIPKYQLDEKMFGVFPHNPLDLNHPLLRGFDDVFYVPHSRHTEIRRSDIDKCDQLQILSNSDISGIHIVSDLECRKFFVTGHSEYDRNTLSNEYFRDVNKGLNIKMPYNYFPDNDDKRSPKMVWRGTANLLFSNWLNYFVYQKTFYDLANFNG